MHPQAILDDLAACGIAPRLTPDGRGIALPAGQLNPAQRTAITANKAALIEFLQAIDQLPKAPPAPAKPMGRWHMNQPWRAADRLYQNHHWQCSVCKAAARGHSERCTEGQRLRDMVYAAVDAAGNEAMLNIVAAIKGCRP